MLATGRWQTDPDPRHRFRDKGRGRPPGEIGDSPKACPWRRGAAAPSPEPGPIPIALSTGRQERGGAPCSARDTPTIRSAPWSSGSPVRRSAWAGRARRIASQVLRRSRRGGTAPGPRVTSRAVPRGAREIVRRARLRRMPAELHRPHEGQGAPRRLHPRAPACGPPAPRRARPALETPFPRVALRRQPMWADVVVGGLGLPVSPRRLGSLASSAPGGTPADIRGAFAFARRQPRGLTYGDFAPCCASPWPSGLVSSRISTTVASVTKAIMPPSRSTRAGSAANRVHPGRRGGEGGAGPERGEDRPGHRDGPSAGVISRVARTGGARSLPPGW